MKHMIKKTVALVALGLVWGLVAVPEAEAAKRPNVLFIFTDDHSARAISAYGSRINRTPHMDRIAQEGMRFRKCYVTNSICGPSRAVILTGKYSHLNGFLMNGRTPFDGSPQTFPKLLRKVGYATAMIGKWHLKSVPTGFDYFDVLIGQGPYYNPPMRTTNDAGEVVVEKNTGYTTDIVTDKALAWLKNDRAADKPFMLMLQHKAPHRNWQPGPAHLHTFDDVEIPEPETLWDDYSGRTSAASNQAMTVARHLSENDLKLNAGPNNLTPKQKKVWDAAYGPKNEAFRKANLEGRARTKWMYQRYIKDYLRCVQSVDDNIGRVLKYLDDTGLAENTVVIYSSDQGWYLGEHGWYDKRWMYEESLVMPFIVRWPGVIEAGSINNDIVSNLDFAETFLEIAGADIPGDMQGRSLKPLFAGKARSRILVGLLRLPGRLFGRGRSDVEAADWRKSLFYQYYEFPGPHAVRRHMGVRDARYKLIHFYNLDEWELYDLQSDPDELQNLYGKKGTGKLAANLKKQLRDLQKHYEDDSDISEKPMEWQDKVRPGTAEKN